MFQKIFHKFFGHSDKLKKSFSLFYSSWFRRENAPSHRFHVEGWPNIALEDRFVSDT